MNVIEPMAITQTVSKSRKSPKTISNLKKHRDDTPNDNDFDFNSDQRSLKIDDANGVHPTSLSESDLLELLTN